MAHAFYSRSLKQWIEFMACQSRVNPMLTWATVWDTVSKGRGWQPFFVYYFTQNAFKLLLSRVFFCFCFYYSTLWIYHNLGCFDLDAIIKSHYYRNSINISLVHTQEWNSPQAFEELPISKAPVPLWIHTRNEWVIAPIFSSSSPKLSFYFNHSSRYGMVADCE